MFGEISLLSDEGTMVLLSILQNILLSYSVLIRLSSNADDPGITTMIFNEIGGVPQFEENKVYGVLWYRSMLFRKNVNATRITNVLYNVAGKTFCNNWFGQKKQLTEHLKNFFFVKLVTSFPLDRREDGIDKKDESFLRFYPTPQPSYLGVDPLEVAELERWNRIDDTAVPIGKKYNDAKREAIGLLSQVHFPLRPFEAAQKTRNFATDYEDRTPKEKEREARKEKPKKIKKYIVKGIDPKIFVARVVHGKNVPTTRHGDDIYGERGTLVLLDILQRTIVQFEDLIRFSAMTELTKAITDEIQGIPTFLRFARYDVVWYRTMLFCKSPDAERITNVVCDVAEVMFSKNWFSERSLFINYWKSAFFRVVQELCKITRGRERGKRFYDIGEAVYPGLDDREVRRITQFDRIVIKRGEEYEKEKKICK